MAASSCRAALTVGSRSLATKSKILTRGAPTTLLLSSTARPFFSASRALSILGGMESLMPLHSAIASARLRSNIAVDSSSWSWLSRGKFFIHFTCLLSTVCHCCVSFTILTVSGNDFCASIEGSHADCKHKHNKRHGMAQSCKQKHVKPQILLLISVCIVSLTITVDGHEKQECASPSKGNSRCIVDSEPREISGEGGFVDGVQPFP
ncbi:hypothetical protein SAY87_008671 [Trapa incisa]|uniref:Uncharacterized protein n=1 Tax=Trapa incisa TaxID=236973 RepID=A0AAN7JW99_9MYRT|nr:hypothetical protein SAY87_008671 [Trapa incisa]